MRRPRELVAIRSAALARRFTSRSQRPETSLELRSNEVEGASERAPEGTLRRGSVSLSRPRLYLVGRSGMSVVVLRIGPILAFACALSVTGVGLAGDTPTATARTIADGRLATENRLAEAAAKLSEGWTASRAPEVLFELAVCYERQGMNAQAAESFRAYIKVPLTLRVRAAEDHLRAIESKDEREVAAPRRVLVPIDRGKCFQDCTGPSSRRSLFGDRWGTQCAATQFVCLRACSGARVESGPCATASIHPSEKCRAEHSL